MVAERELVGLLYRADWTRLTLSGTVRGIDTGLPSIFAEKMSEWGGRAWSASPPLFTPPFPPPSREADPELERTLVVAPGQRFREDVPDGSYAAGCDGERIWQWFGERPAAVTVRFDDRPQPPFPVLLAPSWLLTGYELTVGDEVAVCGRSGVRVLATPPERRRRGWPHGRIAGIMPVPAKLRPWRHTWDSVDAVVDLALGILLSCSRRSGDEVAQVTEFTSLTVGGPEPAAERFRAPEGSVSGSRAEGGGGQHSGGPGGSGGSGGSGGGLGESLAASLEAFGKDLEAFGKDAAKTVAGLAAGGLGAAIRLGSSQRVDPFARATAEADDPDPAMPLDESVPDEAPGAAEAAVSDEVLHLLYRSGLGEPRIAATLHEWHDIGALLDAVPRSARGIGFGGVGYLLDSVREVTGRGGLDTGHQVSGVRVGGWDRYRIDVTLPAWSAAQGDDPVRAGRRQSTPRTVACDGSRRWEVYADRVVTGPAGPPPEDVADLLDASWLLAYELSGGEEVVTDGGRRGYRVVVRNTVPWPPRMPPGISLCIPPGLAAMAGIWQGLFFPAVAVLDAESGRLLRLTRYKGGQPVLRHELRDVVALGADDFGFTPPAGLRVVERTDWNRPEGTGAPRPDDGGWTWTRFFSSFPGGGDRED